MKPHILGAIMMNYTVMSVPEFDAWMKREGYELTEQRAIREAVEIQLKERKMSYGKVY